MFSHLQKGLLFLSAICLAATAAKADVSGGTYYTNFTTTENFDGTEPINVSGTFTVDKWAGQLGRDDFTAWNFTFTESNDKFVLTPANSTFQFLGNPYVESTAEELSFQAATRSDGVYLSGLVNGSIDVEWWFRGGPGLDLVTIAIPDFGYTSAGLPLSGNKFTLQQQGVITSAVPEPSSAFLLGIGGLCVGAASVVKIQRQRARLLAG